MAWRLRLSICILQGLKIPDLRFRDETAAISTSCLRSFGEE